MNLLNDIVLYKPLKCPGCGGADIIVCKTMPDRRYTRCRDCARKFYAIEITQTATEFKSDCARAKKIYAQYLKKKTKALREVLVSVYGNKIPGNVTINPGGYILINGIPKHRIVMEKAIGRKLNKEEVVHHINGIKHDNRLVNLKLLPNESAHRSLHHKINASSNSRHKAIARRKKI